ncbi:MAG TPA: AI-2E family transporter [Gammaproteobacteria bacterium]|nr:AI-2E family transporter [Gammaproteobacteria bacterium]
MSRQPPEPRFRKLFAVAVVLAFSLLFFRMIAPFLEAVIVAAVLSGLLYPLFRRLARSLPNRPVAAVVTVVLVFVAVVLPILFIVFAFVREAARLTAEIAPWIQAQLSGEGPQLRVPDWIPFADYLEPYRDQILSRLGDIVSQAGAYLVNAASAITEGTLLFVLNLFIMLYTMFFLFMAGPRLATIFDYLPLTPEDLELIAEKGIAIARATIKGTIVVGLLQGLLAGAAFAVAGIQGPVFWGVVMAFASVIPGIGAAIVWIPAVVYLFVAGHVVAGIALLAWCMLVVSSVDNVVRPWLVGSDARMPDVLILLSTLGGIAMFGAAGIIIGPIVAGFFLTSWHIFSAAFRDELDKSEEAPPLLDEETEGLAHRHEHVHLQREHAERAPDEPAS